MVAASELRNSAAPELGYRAYLLRCWLEADAGPGGEPAWRFVLMQPGDEGTRRGFASLEALVRHLRAELAAAGRAHKAAVP